jgi:hypothetical protein
VPEIRQLWALICADGTGASRFCLSTTEPSRDEVDAAEGVLLLAGMLKDDAASLLLPIIGVLPQLPRYDLFQAVSGADGVAKIVFDPPFTTAPKAQALAVPSTLAGPVKAEIVRDTLTAAGCRVRVETSAPATGAISALAGATVTVSAVGF